MSAQKTNFLKNHFEQLAWAQELYACGIDEVGRGCLAGPVVVAAVILPHTTSYHLLKDSKVLNEEERNKAYNWITTHCHWATGIANHRTIDAINIYQATMYAMKKALLNLIETLPFPYEQLKYVLIDAMPISLNQAYVHDKLEFYHAPKGELWSSSIAAASIVAKVTRDALMSKLIHQQFPLFNFKQHKGYATKQHIQALLSTGATIIHRTSFIDSITDTSLHTTFPQSQIEIF